MTKRRRRDRAAPAGREKAPPRPPGVGGDGWRAAFLLALLLAAVGAIGLWSWLPRRHRGGHRVGLPPAAMMDSAMAAVGRQDWRRAVGWAERVAHADPQNAIALLGFAQILHDYVQYGSPSARPRSATRTSLERIACEARALALMDSAAGLSRSAAEWVLATESSGQTLEILGLPLDALEAYRRVIARVPTSGLSRAHIRSLSMRLADPLAPDPLAPVHARDALAIPGLPGLGR